MDGNQSLDEIVLQLGSPAVRGSNYAIFHGDSLELMSRLRPQQLPLTITSPPYNIGKEYESIRDVSDYIDWCECWIQQVHNLTTVGGSFWLNLGYLSYADRAKAIPIPYLLWDRVPFFLLQEVVWSYGAGVSSKRCFSPRNEKFLWYVKDSENYCFNLDSVRDPNVKYPNQKKNGKLKCNPLGKNPGDVWYFPKVTSGKNRSSKERTAHPAQFPLAVIDRIVKACSNPHNIVFDPFLGSGTVIEAAIRNNRIGVGFEKEERYIAIAKRRLQRLEVTQTTLF